MSVKVVDAQSGTGPRSGSSWYTAGENVSVQSSTLNASQVFTAAVGTAEIPLFVVPPVSTRTYRGGYQSTTEGDNVWGHINGVYVCAGGTALAANTANLTLGLVLKRAGATVGGGNFAGWGAAANAALAAYTPVLVPFLTANTLLVSAANATLTAANALLPVQPLDVVCLSIVVATANVTTMPFLDILVDIA